MRVRVMIAIAVTLLAGAASAQPTSFQRLELQVSGVNDSATLWFNGTEVQAIEDFGVYKPFADVTNYLRDGENAFRVQTLNAHGGACGATVTSTL